MPNSSDLLENLYTSQYQSAEYKSYWFYFQRKFLSILTSSKLIKRVLEFFPMTIFGLTHRLTWS